MFAVTIDEHVDDGWVDKTTCVKMCGICLVASG